MSDTVISVIRPRTDWFRIDLNVLWRYRDLLWSFVLRDVKVRYRQTILGPLWLVIQPLTMTGILTAVVHGVAGLKTNSQEPILFYFSAIILWQYFAQAVQAISQVFIVNEYLFNKVYFPRIVVPASIVLANSIGLAIQLVPFFGVMAALTIFGKFHPSLTQIWMMPVALAELMAVSLGIGLIIASSTAKYRDLANATPFLLQAGLFLTPVLYPLSAFPESVRLTLAIFNPLSTICETWRSGAMGGGGVTVTQFAVSLFSTIVVLFAGTVLFQRAERTAADTI
jgi:lipopolysaccharide transport system permease protein